MSDSNLHPIFKGIIDSQLRIHSVVGSASDKCTKCPECGCDKYVNKDELGKGYRVCASCTQEWYIDVDYDN